MGKENTKLNRYAQRFNEKQNGCKILLLKTS